MEKVNILLIIYALLLIFYLVISRGAGKKFKSKTSKEITRYLSGVRILIIVIALVSFILWLFL